MQTSCLIMMSPQSHEFAAMTIKMKTDFLLNFWRKAYDSPVTLSFGSYKEANAFRLRLYVAVRPFRDEANGDMELHCKINQMEAIARTTDDGKGQLIIRHAELNDELVRLAKEAGISYGFDVDSAQASQQRMLEALTPTPKPSQVELGVSSDVGDTYSDDDRKGVYDE